MFDGGIVRELTVFGHLVILDKEVRCFRAGVLGTSLFVNPVMSLISKVVYFGRLKP